MLLLALYATLDFSAQYLLAATPLATVLSPDVRDFMKVLQATPTFVCHRPHDSNILAQALVVAIIHALSEVLTMRLCSCWWTV